MKKIIYLLLVSIFVFTSCNQEDEILDVTLKKGKPEKTTICHYNPHNDTYKTVSVNEKQLAKHLEHGDSRAPCGYTYVPDDLFEKNLIYYGYDDILDNYVLTSNINTLTSFGISNVGDNGPFELEGYIYDFTGLEDFVALSHLYIAGGNFEDFDLSKNTNLTSLNLGFGPDGNAYALTSLDLSNNILLSSVEIYKSRNLTSLDFSNNPLLNSLTLHNHQNLTSLNLKNGNNSSLSIDLLTNRNLTCIQVDNVAYSNANWRLHDNFLAYFSEDCGY